MSQYKYAEIADTVYFWFAANDTTGDASDGATPLFHVRLAGAAANAAPTINDGTPALLSEATYPKGLFEIAIDTTGYAAGEYAVFCALTVSAVNPGGFVGSFKLRTAGTAALMVQVPTTQKVDVETIKTRAITCGAAVTIRADVGHAGIPGAENGAAYVAAGGAKLAQTVDLTAGQTIAATVADKAGYSLAATGADLILHGATFMVALATAVWELGTRTLSAFSFTPSLHADYNAAKTAAAPGAKMDLIDAPNATGISAIVTAINSLATYGLTALNTLLVTTGIKAATIPAATLAANQHVIVDSGTVTTLTGHTAQTGDSFAIVNGAHGLVSIQDDIDEILTDTGTTIPGTITTMQGNVTTIMADTDLLDDAIGGLADIHTDVAAVKAETALIVADTNELQTDWANNGRLDLILDAASAPTASAVASAVWDEVLHTTHEVAGSASVLLQASGGAADPLLNAVPGVYGAGTAGYVLGTNLAAVYGATEKAAIDLLDDAAGGLVDIHTDVAAVKAETALIVADTNELQADWTNAGRLDAILDVIAADTTTDIPALIADVPTVAEFNARTIVSADYTVVTDLGTVQTADHTAAIADIPTVAEFNARTLVSADYTVVGDLPTEATITDAVWDEVLHTDHEVASSASVLVQAAGIAADPWAVALPAGYVAGTAGYRIGSISGTGSVTWPYILTDANLGTAIEGATVWATAASTGASVLASGITDNTGTVVFFLDPGTVYVWRSKAGYSFSNPDTETVV